MLVTIFSWGCGQGRSAELGGGGGGGGGDTIKLLQHALHRARASAATHLNFELVVLAVGHDVRFGFGFGVCSGLRRGVMSCVVLSWLCGFVRCENGKKWGGGPAYIPPPPPHGGFEITSGGCGNIDGIIEHVSPPWDCYLFTSQCGRGIMRGERVVETFVRATFVRGGGGGGAGLLCGGAALSRVFNVL